MSHDDIEEIKEEEEHRNKPGIQQERIVASQQSQRNKNKKYLDSQEQSARQSRPLTVDDNVVKKRGKYFEPVQEEPEGVEDLDENTMNTFI